MTDTKKIEVLTPGVRAKFEDWIKTRGGVAVWKNADLSNCGAGDVFTPAKTAMGAVYDKPHWSWALDRVVTELTEFRFVREMREVKRFHVALRMGSQGLKVKCTDASSARIRKACDKAGPDNTYRFDYETQEAVIEVPVWED